MPLEWTFRPRAGRRHGDVSRYEARIGHGLFLSVRKEYGSTSQGPEEWQIIAIKRAEMAHISGLQAAQPCGPRSPDHPGIASPRPGRASPTRPCRTRANALAGSSAQPSVRRRWPSAS